MMEGMSAANAAVDNTDAAPAAIRDLTLRIGFVLLSGEADEASHQKLTSRRCHQILKRRLTLIFKVDNLRRFFCAPRENAGAATIVNDVLTKIVAPASAATPGNSGPAFRFAHGGLRLNHRTVFGIFGRNTASRPMAGRNAQI